MFRVVGAKVTVVATFSVLVLLTTTTSSNGQILSLKRGGRAQTPPAVPTVPPKTKLKNESIPFDPATCPCVRPPSGGPCVAYNARYQAATLEEAVMNFGDTTVEPDQALNIFGMKPSSVLQSSGNGGGGKPLPGRCRTYECVACFQALTERLVDAWGANDIASLGLGLSNLSPQVIGSPNVRLSQSCRRLQDRPGGTTGGTGSGNGGNGNGNGNGNNNGNRPSSSSNSNSGSSSGGSSSSSSSGSSGNNNNGQSQRSKASDLDEDDLRMIVRQIISPIPVSSNSGGNSGNGTASSSNGTSSNSSSTNTSSNGNGNSNSVRTEHDGSTSSSFSSSRSSSSRSGDRHRRESSQKSANLGVSTPLDCSYKRGDPVGDNSGYVGLCNLCWSLRTLSSKYFPRYVNELSCDQSDNGCLSGWGKCRERYRSIDVLHNTGTDAAPKWQQYSINSPVACECQILSGSALHNFVCH